MSYHSSISKTTASEVFSVSKAEHASSRGPTLSYTGEERGQHTSCLVAKQAEILHRYWLVIL